MTSTERDVIVVGGGPSGAATAFFLARGGARVTLLDKARFPRDKPCAEYLSPQASRILHEMGVEGAVEDAGAAKLRGMIVRAPNGSTLRGDFVADHGYRAFRDCGLAIRRSVLDDLLLDRARDAGVEVVEGAAVRHLIRNESGRVTGVHVAPSKNGDALLRAPLVVGADGLNSIVASQAGLTRRDRWPRRYALVTHFEDVADVTDFGEMHVDGGAYLGIARVGVNTVNVALVVPRRQARRIRGNTREFLMAWILQRPHLAERFAAARMISRVTATGPFARRTVRPWAPGIVLVGDAADFFDPFTGEGIYSALRGGELLAETLLRGNILHSEPAAAHRQDVLLAQYAEARQKEFGAKMLVERMVGLAISCPPLINRVAYLLSRRKHMADLMIGVTGDFVPAGEVLRPGYLLGLFV